jgi:hypothetical protein
LNFILAFVYPGMKVDSKSNLCTSGVKVTLWALSGQKRWRRSRGELPEGFEADQ